MQLRREREREIHNSIIFFTFISESCNIHIISVAFALTKPPFPRWWDTPACSKSDGIILTYHSTAGGFTPRRKPPQNSKYTSKRGGRSSRQLPCADPTVANRVGSFIDSSR